MKNFKKATFLTFFSAFYSHFFFIFIAQVLTLNSFGRKAVYGVIINQFVIIYLSR